MNPAASSVKNRFRSRLLAFALGLSVSVSARAASRELSLPECLASPGMLVQVPLVLDNAAGLASLRVVLNFSPQLLELQGIAPGPLGNGFELSQSAADGVIQLLFTRDTNLTAGAGRLAVLTFKVNAGAEADAFSRLTVAEFQVGDESGVLDVGAIGPVTTVSGRVTVNSSLYLDADHDGLPDRWETSHGLSMLDASALDDPDKDGLTNLAEYALGLDPLQAGQATLLPRQGTVQLGGVRYLTLSFRRLIAPPPDLAYHVEESLDLINWSPLDPATYQVSPPVDQGDGTESLTVQGTIPLSGPEAERRGFMHLRINNGVPASE